MELLKGFLGGELDMQISVRKLSKFLSKIKKSQKDFSSYNAIRRPFRYIIQLFTGDFTFRAAIQVESGRNEMK